MPPRAKPRAATAKADEAETEPAVNGTRSSRTQRNASRAANGVAEEPKKAPGRPRKEATPAIAPKAPPKRTKATASPAEDDGEAPAPKRKKDEAASTPDGDVDAEPPAKKTKTTREAKPAKAAVAKRHLPKGPRRIKGKKTEINALRYTEPLKVFVFGEGGQGELGLGATKRAIDVKRPRWNEALTNQNVVKIATGGMHVVALTKDNRILTWGVNDNGALGRETSSGEVLKDMKEGGGDDSDSDSDDETGGLNALEATPTAISADHFPEDTVFVDVVAGDSCSFALTTEGAVYGWGTFRKNEGILGFERNNHTAHMPVYLDTITKVTHLACGTNHVLALTKDQHVYAWGNGQQNQLGRRVNERTLTESLLPNRVGFHDHAFKRPSQKIKKIACGDYHGLAIAEDGHVWSWGANNYCETGHTENAGDDNASILTPRIIASLEGKGVTAVEGGSHHNIALTQSGQVLAWGRCDGSQTGIPAAQLNAIDDKEKVLKANGKAKILLEPTAIPGLSDIVTGACGPEHTIVINKDGKAYSWGFSANYQTGQGTEDEIETPTLIDNTAVRDVKLIFAGAGGQYSVLASLKE